MSEEKNANIQGEPLELNDLLDYAIIDIEDIESALLWWDEVASPEWRGALENEPIDDATN